MEVDLTPSWFALILQGGSFGVLVYMFIWGLPKLRKEIAEEHKADLKIHADENKDQRKEFIDALALTTNKAETSLALATKTFKEEVAAERQACERHFSTLADAMGRGNEATITTVKTMAEQIQQHALRNQQWAKMLVDKTTEIEAKERKKD